MSMASGSGGGMMQSNPAKLKKSHIVCTMRPLRVCIEENSGDISRCVKEVEEFERTCDKRLEYDSLSAMFTIAMGWMILEAAFSVVRSSAQTELSWERPAELDPSPDGNGGSTSSTTGHAKHKDSAVPGPWRDRESDREELKKLRSDEGKSEGKGKRDRRRAGGKSDASSKEPSFGPPGCNLFVFHLPDDWTDDDLLEYFAPHGNVVSAKVMKELGTGRSRGFGFVSYEDRVSAATAIKKMQGYKILGKRLKVEFKKGEGDNGKGEADKIDLIEEKSSGDDERLIGYLRAISAKSVVQSLKESEKAAEEMQNDLGNDTLGD
ncbi:celf3 [Symbiodinium natans]|uniref:Celf3 protein n=1 Tax=Symbiodinium natans TaxID=878477 RepID=A0A812N4C4_9DINO|nr:celf3 [Symbiodinium natans]